MAKCKNCNNLYNLSDEKDVIVGKWCPKITDSPDTEIERDCEHYKVMSQADRIRSMTDKELAEMLGKLAEPLCDCRLCPVSDKCDSLASAKDSCEEIFTKWLRSPVEV